MGSKFRRRFESYRREFKRFIDMGRGRYVRKKLRSKKAVPPLTDLEVDRQGRGKVKSEKLGGQQDLISKLIVVLGDIQDSVMQKRLIE